MKPVQLFRTTKKGEGIFERQK